MMSEALFLTLAGVFWSIGETSRWEWAKNMLTSALGTLVPARVRELCCSLHPAHGLAAPSGIGHQLLTARALYHGPIVFQL